MNYEINLLSIVVPIYNDEEVLPELCKRLAAAMETLPCKAHEFVFIDDGSRDRSWNTILELQKQYPEIVAVKLAGNFGQQNAIAAGFDRAGGDIIVLMDSDLQDKPEDIHKLVDALYAHNTSMAIAQWISRKDTSFKMLVSKLFFQVSNSITSIKVEPRLGCFRALRRHMIDGLKQFPETTSTTLSILYFIERNYVCVPLERDARFAGTSGYNLKKMFSLAMSRILSYSMFPLRVMTATGLLLCLSSFLVVIALVVRRFYGSVVPGWTSLIALILLLFGVNFAFLGVFGEYIGMIYKEVKRRPKYVIEQELSRRD